MVCLESFPLGGIEAPLTGLQEACTPVPPPGVTADLTVAQDEAQDVDAGATYRPCSGFLGCPGTDVCLRVSGTASGLCFRDSHGSGHHRGQPSRPIPELLEGGRGNQMSQRARVLSAMSFMGNVSFSAPNTTEFEGRML